LLTDPEEIKDLLNKEWGEIYNQETFPSEDKFFWEEEEEHPIHNIPKKLDILELDVIEAIKETKKHTQPGEDMVSKPGQDRFEPLSTRHDIYRSS